MASKNVLPDSDLFDELQERLARGVDELREYLASPEGRAMRQRVAQVTMVAAPLLFRMRFFRKTLPGRLIGVFGGAALVVKLAEILRDWEPQQTLRVVED